MRVLVLLILSSSLSLLNAQGLWWIGGSGDWDDGSKWSLSSGGSSCSCVPGSSDVVIIDEVAGMGTEIVTVPDGYTARAEKVWVNEDAFLLVGSSSAGIGQLILEDPIDDGLNIQGEVWVYDILAVKDAPANGIFIESTGTLDVKADGLVDIRPNDGVVGHGIRNEGYVITRNNAAGQGTINIFNINGNGIFSVGSSSVFDNKGNLFVDNTNTNDDDGIFVNQNAVFNNKPNGMIDIRNIDQVNAQGIDNRGLFMNEGTIEMRNISGAAAITSSLTTSTVFVNTGMIELMDIGHHGIRTFNNGEFRNSGVITMNQLFGDGHHGILNNTEFKNLTGGQISITDVDGNNSRGIYNDSNFENDGDISVDDVSGSNGIYNSGVGTLFLNTGSVTVSNTNFAGVLNDNSTNFHNNGSLTINQVSEAALRNKSKATFANTATINISASVGADSHGISNQINSSFTNGSGGVINITNINGTDSKGIDNQSSTFVNNGNISIDDVEDGEGIRIIASDITNNDLIQMHQMSKVGILNENGTMNNNGTINITDAIGVNTLGINNRNSATINNDGLLFIDGSTGTGVQNQGVFSNLSSGIIEIQRFANNGITNQNPGNIINEGSIQLRDNISAAFLSGLSNGADFENYGTIVCERLAGNGFKGLVNGKNFDNYGEITIDMVEGSGIRANPISVFRNRAGGEITISNSIDGIVIVDDFINYGQVTLEDIDDVAVSIEGPDGLFENQASGVVIHRNDNSTLSIDVVNGEFYNRPCGMITIFEGISNNNTFENQGFLFQNFNGSNVLITPLINTGVIEDRLGSFEAVIMSTNTQGAMAGPLHGHHVTGIYSQGVLLGDLAGISSGTEYYSESTLINPVGSYNLANNEWLPSAAAVSSMFIELNDGCATKVVRQNLDNPTLSDCSEVPATSNEYSKSAGAWHDVFGWNWNQIPTSCTIVSIPGSKGATIGTGMTGRGKELEIAHGGVFTVEGILDIRPN